MLFIELGGRSEVTIFMETIRNAQLQDLYGRHICAAAEIGTHSQTTCRV